MKEERERRNDFGKIRVGQRDLIGMDFVARSVKPYILFRRYSTHLADIFGFLATDEP